jgi:hypothetical protein
VNSRAATVSILLLCATLQVAADTHQFLPQTFYNTYSFAHPPALRIKPGDRVVTKTSDASGVDWNGKIGGAAARTRRPARSTSKAPSPETHSS